MTLLEYVQTLSSDISVGEKIALTKAWKNKNQSEIEEEVIETPIEEVKTNGAAGTGAAVVPTEEPVSPEKSIESKLEDSKLKFDFSDIRKTTLSNATSNESSPSLLADPDKTFFQQVGLSPTYKLPEKYSEVSKPKEIYSPGDGWDYKFDFDNKTGSINYFTKKKNDEKFIPLKNETQKFYVADVFNHLNEEQKVLIEEARRKEKDFTIGNSLDITEEDKALTPKSLEEDPSKPFKTIEESKKNKQNEEFKIAIGVSDLDINRKIKNIVIKEAYNVENNYEEFKGLEYEGELEINEPGQGVRRVEEDYLLSDLKNLNTGFNVDNFLGFMNEKGYTKDYANNYFKDSYGSLGTYDLSPEDYSRLEINRQRDLDNYLNLYVADQTDRYNNKLYLSYISKNKAKFKDVKSLDEAILKAKKYFKKEYGQSTFAPFDLKKFKGYRDNLFPELVTAEKQAIAAGDEKRAAIKAQGTAEGLLFDSTRKGFQGLIGQAEDQALELRSLLGYDIGVARNLNSERDLLRSATDVRYGYVEGVEAEVDGITYIKDEDGNIYDTTNQTTLGSVTEEEYADISKALNTSKKRGTSFSSAGTTEQFAATGGTMMFDIASVYGLGKFTKVSKIGKLATALKMPKTSFDALTYYTASGYVSTKKDTYSQLINAGVNVDEASELSEIAGRLGGILYGTTSLFAPTSQYMKAFNKAANVNNAVNQAVRGYKKGGKSEFTKIIIDNFKKLKPTKQGAIKTAGAGGQEFVQEELQTGLETLGLNAFINKKAGANILDETFTRQDFISTGILSFGAGAAFSNLNLPGFKPNAQQQLQNLYILSKDIAGTKDLLNKMVIDGEATTEQVSDVMFQIKAVNNQMSGIPSSVSSETQLESAIILQEIADLQNRKKTIDEAFHENIDIKIENKREALAEIVKPELEKSISRKGSKAKAADMDVEFLPFGSQEEIDVKKAEIIAKGGKVIEDVGYGQSLEFKEDGVTKKVILINDQVSAEDNVYTTGKHETLHPFWEQALKGNPELAIKFGKSLMLEFLNNKEISGGAKFLSKFQSYVNDSKYSAEDTWSEVIPLMSEYLSSGDIQYNPKQEAWYKNIGKKISNFLKNPTNKQPLNLRFDTGKDVFDFIVAYNKSTDAGKGWSAAENKVRLEGAKGALVDDDLEVNNTYVVQEGETIEDVAEKFPDITLKQLKQLNKTGGQDLEAGTELIISAEKNLVSNIDLELNKQTENKDSDGSAKASKRDTGAEASTKVQEIFEAQGVDGAFDIIEQFKPIVSRIVEKRSEAPNFDRQLLTDEIETGKRGIFDLIKEYKPESGVPLAAYINKFLPARAIEASQRVLGEEFTVDVTEATGVMAEEVETEVAAKPTTRKIKPSSLISNDAVSEIKEQVKAKIEGIDPKNLTFKKLGDLAPEIIAEEIGIPVKKLTSPTANLSKGDATAIQQFVNKNADKLLKILPEGAVVEAATEKLLGTSTGVPKGLLNAFYTKQARLGKGAGLAPFKLNKGISKADFLEAFGIVEGKKAEGFDARSPQAQALKGIASLYGKLVTNEIVRSDTDLSLEVKQDVAAGKNKSMASKRITTEAEMSPKLKNAFKEVASLRSKTQLARELGFSSPPINEKTRKSLQDDMQKAVAEFGLDTASIEAGMMGSGGRQTFYSNSANGKMYNTVADSKRAGLKNPIQFVKTTDGKFYETKSDQGKLGGKIKNWVAKPSRLYYGKTDPAYVTLIESASKYEGKPAKRNTVKKGFTAEGIAQSKINMEVLDHVVKNLTDAVARGMSLDIAGAIIIQSYQATEGLIKIAAPFKYKSTLMEYATREGAKKTQKEGNKYREEHNPPASVVGASIMLAIKNNAASTVMSAIKENYYQTQLSKKNDDQLDMAKLDSTLVEGQSVFDNPISRLAAAGIDLQTLVNPLTGKTIAEESGFGIDLKVYNKYNVNEKVQASSIQNEAILEGLKNPDLDVASQIKASLPLVPGKSMASKRDSDLIPDAIEYSEPITVQKAINALEKTDKALANGRKLDQPVKKIRVFDFDDTLARTKSNVLYTMPDGTTGAIDAATFAKEAGNMEAEGAQWDFSEFSKVMQGSKGPLLDVAKIIADKRGTKDVFVLTARPANAAGPIKEFLASMGLDIPLANITGLGDGAPAAKAGWIMGKAAEGYNDFYFADDHTGNVKAVKDVLSQIDVKSKVQLAKASKRQTFDTIVNDMIEDSSGIETYKNYSAARAKTIGASKGRFNFFIPPSAEDFTGLLYKMLGKGNKGDAQMAFLKANLLDPYDRAESAVTQAKISAANDFKALKTELKTLPTSLSVPTGIGGFTYSHAVRTAIWTAQGMDIPGLSKKDIKELNDFVQNDPELRVFANELIKIQKGKPYPKPGKDWLGGNITSDIINDINKVNRAEYQQEWRENVDIIFSEDNMNKMEAAYGTRWREAMEDSLRRMKSGSNRPPGGNRATDGILDWLNNSVGAVMFLNTRSALLQTISAVNFINWGDNNIVKAGAAFANQKQFWADFMTLMNSDYLVERRNGLKINVSESEIADAVRDSGNKPKAAIAFLLSKGFVMTRFADSFAIATGGSTFYRNRVKALVAKGMEQKAAEAQAFEDFRQIAEESQQSSNPNRISAQQASAAGRVILAWANTPMQYARIQKRAGQDLINGRGDWKTNVSKIVYYGAIQNLIFNSLQQAVFALGFGEDDEEKDAKKNEKISRVANGMIDSQLKGLGIGGAAVLALKSALMELGKQHAKKRSEYEEAVFDLLNFSPPLGSKINKIRGGLRSFSWNMKDMREKGFSLDNPAYLAGAQIVTGLTNVPLDRVAKKINNVRAIVNEQSALWQKVALGLGWSTWDVGLGYYGGFDAAKVLTPEEEKVKEIDDMKKLTKTKEQVDMLLDLGLSKKEIKALGKEQARVEKIIELQNAEAEPKKEAEVKEEIKEETKPTPVAKPKPTPKPKVKTVSAEARLRRQFDSIKDENKPDQVKTLLKFGLSKKEIRALKYEKNRVEKILELMPKNK